MKILSIGNSFSEDAQSYLKKIADSVGAPLKAVNLFIGGCSLSIHADCIRNNSKSYMYELNGERIGRAVSVEDVINEEDWDIITVQQASQDSGKYETYYYGLYLLGYIKAKCANSKVFFHETWAYESDSEARLVNYGKSQEQMYNSIKLAANHFCQENGLPVIPVGEVIAEIRKQPLFDYPNGGQSLCRDGSHLHLIYGRYAAGATWFETLLGGDILKSDYIPKH